MSKNNIDLSNLMYKGDDNLRSSNVGTKKQIIEPEIIEKLIEKPKKEIKKKEKPQQPTEDEVIQKRRLKEVLQQYLSTFPEKLKSFKKINLEKQDLEQLKELQHEMDFCISNNANIGTGTELVLSGINAFEFLCVNFTPLQIAGLHAAMKNDPESMDTIKHLCLKHLGSSMISSEPEHRLMYKVITTAFSMHAMNTFAQNMNQHNDSIIYNVNDRFGDLPSELII